jgi:hypothetical protein
MISMNGIMERCMDSMGSMMGGMMGAKGWLWEDRGIKGSGSGERD